MRSQLDRTARVRHADEIPWWSHLTLRMGASIIAALAGTVTMVSTLSPASAIGTSVHLGTAGAYAVLSGQTVTNTGPSVLNRSLGVHPGTTHTGLLPEMVNGAFNIGNEQAELAKLDLTAAYLNAAGQAPDANIPSQLENHTLLKGVYKAPDSLEVIGSLTLDAAGDSNAVFIFQMNSTLVTSTNSTVNLINGAQSCNVFWQVGSSATLNTDTTFVGTIMALASISLKTGTTVEGRALARNGSVTLESNVFTGGECNTASPSASPGATTPGSPTDSVSATPPPTASNAPTASSSAPPSGTPTSPSTRTVSPPPSDTDQSLDVGNAEPPGSDTLADSGAQTTPILMGFAFAVLAAGLLLRTLSLRRVSSEDKTLQ